MTMQCIKTGCHAYLEEYNEYVYGDAHVAGGMLVLRIVQRSHAGPLSDRLHFTVRHIDGWFDKGKTGGECSTLLAHAYANHGYGGIAVEAGA